MVIFKLILFWLSFFNYSLVYSYSNLVCKKIYKELKTDKAKSNIKKYINKRRFISKAIEQNDLKLLVFLIKKGGCLSNYSNKKITRRALKKIDTDFLELLIFKYLSIKDKLVFKLELSMINKYNINKRRKFLSKVIKEKGILERAAIKQDLIALESFLSLKNQTLEKYKNNNFIIRKLLQNKESLNDQKILIISKLLKENAEINFKNSFGETILHLACKNNHLKAAKLIIKAEANVNVQDLFGYSPLHYAILRNNLDLVNLLLNEKAKINLQGKYDLQSPLHLAAQKDYYEIAKILLKSNVDIALKNDANRTALDLADYNDNLVTKKLIVAFIKASI